MTGRERSTQFGGTIFANGGPGRPVNRADSHSGLGHVDELTTTCRSGVRSETVTADGALDTLDTCTGRVILPSCGVTAVSDDSNSESRWGTGRSESESGGEDSETGWGTDSGWDIDNDGATAASQDLDTPESDSDHPEQDRKRAQMFTFVMWTLILMVEGYTLLVVEEVLLGVAAGVVLYLLFRFARPTVG